MAIIDLEIDDLEIELEIEIKPAVKDFSPPKKKEDEEIDDGKANS